MFQIVVEQAGEVRSTRGCAVVVKIRIERRWEVVIVKVICCRAGVLFSRYAREVSSSIPPPINTRVLAEPT